MPRQEAKIIRINLMTSFFITQKKIDSKKWAYDQDQEILKIQEKLKSELKDKGKKALMFSFKSMAVFWKSAPVPITFLFILSLLIAVFNINRHDFYQNLHKQSEQKKQKKEKKEEPEEEEITKQQARDIMFMTANLLYETIGYPDIMTHQREAYRVISTSVINKRDFESHPHFESVITQTKPSCQYSWYCQKGKPVDLHYLKETFEERFEIAFEMSARVVLGDFQRTPAFDGAFYVATYAYEGSWHQKEVRKGKQCRRRTIDNHVHTAVNISGNCKDLQTAFYQ